MKIAARKTNQNRLFEWFLRDQNTALFLRISAVLNFGFAAIPVASLAWFTIPVEEVPLLEEIRAKHPEMILMVIRENCVFLISVLVCCIIISLEIFYCLKTNWSILKVCSVFTYFLNIKFLDRSKDGQNSHAKNTFASTFHVPFI
jgi:hypothetical protein